MRPSLLGRHEGVWGMLPPRCLGKCLHVVQKPSFATFVAKACVPSFLQESAALAYTMDRSGRLRPEHGKQPNDGFRASQEP